MAARLRSDLWVAALVKRADRDAIAVAVLHRGDPASGALLVKLNQRGAGCRVLSETRDAEGRPAWFSGTGLEPVAEAEAEAYLERCRRRDPDAWVVEIDDARGRMPFEGRILDV